MLCVDGQSYILELLYLQEMKIRALKKERDYLWDFTPKICRTKGATIIISYGYGLFSIFRMG